MKKLLIFVWLVFAVLTATSQKYSELGAFGGLSYFSGDVHSEISRDSHLALGLSFRRNINSRWAWKNDFRWAQISGADQYSDKEFEVQRNQSFEGNIFEIASTVEFNFFDFHPYRPQSFFQKSDIMTPYIFIGLSLFYHNPKTYLAGNLYELRPYETEGKSYTKVALAIPFGMGLKFRLSDRVLLGMSLEFRATATDYLDDVSGRYPDDPSSMSKTARDLSDRTLQSQDGGVGSWGSQRGNSYRRDWFSLAGITLTFNLKKNPSNCHFN